MTSLNDDQCRCGDIVRFSVGNQSEMVYSKDRGKSRLLPQSVVNLLISCQNFNTIREHVQSFLLKNHLGPENAPSFTNQLQDLLNEGFLFSKNQLIEKCRNHIPSEKNTVPITSIGLPTRNRVKALERGLASFIENSLAHERTVEFVVVDRSDDPQTRSYYREMLKDQGSKYGVKIYYAGLEEKSQFAQKMISQGLSPDIVDFALFDPEKIGYGPGSNRNALLLDCAGAPIMMTDDDTVCRLTHAPGFGKTLRFLSGQDPTELSFFQDSETMLNTIPFVEKDILSVHEEFLGQDVWSCIRASDSNIHLDSANTAFLNKIFSDHGTVLTTQTGILGDSGAGSPTGLLSLEGESRQKLLRSDDDYRQAIMNRLELRKAKFPTLTNGSFCMTTSIGLDLRKTVPPFMPVYRNSDGVFGVTLRHCFQKGFMAHLPIAILHQPLEEKRSFSPDDVWNSSAEAGMDEIVMQSIQIFSMDHFPRNEVETMKILGRKLIELGSCDLKEFSQIIILRMLKARELYIRHLQNLLERHHEQPAFWAQDVKRRLEKIRTTLNQNKNINNLANTGTDTDTLTLWRNRQRLIMRFGQLLHDWPEMIECASILHSNGERLSKAV